MEMCWRDIKEWCLYCSHFVIRIFAAFAHWRLGLSVSSTITPKPRWWFTHLRSFPFNWYWGLLFFACWGCSLRTTHLSVLKLIRAPLGPDWQLIDVILQSLVIRWALNCSPNFHVVHKHNRIIWGRLSIHLCTSKREQFLVQSLTGPHSLRL